jgi:hypothetical protein
MTMAADFLICTSSSTSWRQRDSSDVTIRKIKKQQSVVLARCSFNSFVATANVAAATLTTGADEFAALQSFM